MASQQDVALAVKRLQWRHHREANRKLSAQVGISLVQWDVLRRIEQSPGLSLHALAEATFQTDQSMGELAKRMIDRELIKRVDGAGRAVRHELTSRGRTAYQAGAGILDEVLAETLGRLGVEERSTLLGLIDKALGD
ncbi:MarR family winged helix-turn-helix transcriptional regulator [Nakamurella endophytica]|uniref:MarR family transcriptional regulator n=1 Tax=Nakamurella endophytica TaxID=1748367 RepID=A0A917SQS9_9ACTN|nr:MarR family winged helix-turn-helix transcriptional regulator [Nakamurella endophytica]GGL91664.1 MarR family transcriptional regulator [Nakamurella endophytica]